MSASGPKGLVKGDVLKYITTNNLKPVAVPKPEKQVSPPVAKPASVKSEAAAKPQFHVG